MASNWSIKTSLEVHRKELLDRLKHGPIVRILADKGAITHLEKQVIGRTPYERHQMGNLLDILVGKDEQALALLLGALEESGQGDLVTLLKESPDRDSQEDHGEYPAVVEEEIGEEPRQLAAAEELTVDPAVSELLQPPQELPAYRSYHHMHPLWRPARPAQLPRQGLCALTEGCLVGCKGCALHLDDTGELLGRYNAGQDKEVVLDICTYDNTIFLLQACSITVHTSGEYSRDPTEKQPYHTFWGGLYPRGLVATSLDTLILVGMGGGGQGGVVMEHKLNVGGPRLIQGLTGPRSVCMHGRGDERRFYITLDYGVQVHGADWTVLLTIGRSGPDVERLMNPQHVTVTDDGSILVADAGNERVCQFTPDGAYLGGVIAWESREDTPLGISLILPYLWVRTYSGKVTKFRIEAL